MAEVSPAPATPASPHPPSHRRRWGRWVALGVTALLIVLIVVVLLLPTLLSTGPGRNLVVGTVNSTIRGTLDIADLSLSWFGGQSLRDVTLRDPQGDVVATVASLEAPDVGLLPVAFGSRDFGVVRIQQPDLQIRQQPGQPTNLEQAIEFRDPSPPSNEPTDLSGMGITLEVTAGHVVYESPDLEPVELNDVNATVAAPTLGDITVKLDSGLTQGGEAGRIAADLRIRDAVANGQVQVERAKLDGTAGIENLPLTPVDRLAQQEGKLVALLGDRLTASLVAEGGVDALSAKLTAKTPRLQQFDATLVTEDGQLRAQQAQVALEVTPEAFAAWAGEGSGSLQQPFVLRASVPTLTAPRQGAALQLERAQVRANIEAEPILLTLPASEPAAVPANAEAPPAEAAAPRDMAVRGLRLEAQSAALGDLVTATLSGTVEFAGASGPIDTRVEVRHLLSETQPLAAQLVAKAFPVPLADAFAGQGGNLTTTLGETLDATVNVTQPPGPAEQPLAFDGTLASRGVSGPFAGTYAADGAITFATPKPLALSISPAAYRAWLGTPEAPPVVVPAEPLQLSATVNAAYAPLPAAEGAPADAPARVDPERTRAVLEVTTPRAVLENTATRERYRIEQLRVAANGNDLREVLEVVANLRINTEVPQAPAEGEGGDRGGAVASTTKVRGLIAPDGTVQADRAAFTTETNAREVPSAILDSLAGQGGQLAALLGATTTAAITGDFEPDRGGKLDVALRSANVRGKIPATIDRDMNVTIPQAALEVHVTPEVGQVMLKKINPILEHAVSAEAPLRFTMSNATFPLPTSGVDWANATANARLTSKGLALNNKGLLGLIAQAVQLSGSNAMSASRYIVDINDVPLKLDNGVLSYQNLGIAFGEFALNFDGNVNLANHQLKLKMNFGQDFPVRQLRGVSVPIEQSLDDPSFNRDIIVKALAGAAITGGLQELLGGDRDKKEERQPQRPRDGQPAPREQPQGEEQPRSPLGGLLRDLIEGERKDQKEEGEPQRQPSR